MIKGITIKDEVTNELTCISTRNGTLTSTPGACDATPSLATTPPAVSPTPPEGDIIPPTVSLNGAAEQTIDINAAWSDLGATASDPSTSSGQAGSGVVGDVMASINGSAAVVAGQVTIDTSVAATHTIIYSASDAAGNVGTVTRTVTVSAPTPEPPPVDAPPTE